MPLTREKKTQVVKEAAELLSGSKMTVITTYRGIAVKDMQQLRKSAATNNTTLKVFKNRLIIQAIKQLDQFKDLDTGKLEGMLAYAFNPDDEVAPAQTLAAFKKANPALEFIGAITSEGKWLDATEVSSLAELPSKPVLIATVISLLDSPVRSVIGGLNGQLAPLLSGLKQAKTN